MLERWPPPRIWSVALSIRNWRAAPKIKWGTFRPESTQAELGGKPSGFKESTRASWQRPAAFGAAIILTLCVVYQVYGNKRQQTSFSTYELIAKQPVSSTSSIFYLRPTGATDNSTLFREAWRKGVWNVHFKQPQLQIVRAYTPLPPTEIEPNGSQDLRFLIRNDQHGEVSSYLHRLPIGSRIELRGPNMEYAITPQINQVTFLAGGTGIAPALQLAHAMFASNVDERFRTDSTTTKRKLHIMWANRRREDCQGGKSDSEVNSRHEPTSLWNRVFLVSHTPTPILPDQKDGPIVEELERLKKMYPGQVTVDYFVDEESTWINEGAIKNELHQTDQNGVLKGSPSPITKQHIIISGPEGFISFLAGPKQWNQGREEQGAVTNIVGRVVAEHAPNVTVWKI